MKNGKAKISEWKGLLKVAIFVLRTIEFAAFSPTVYLSRGHVTGFPDRVASCQWGWYRPKGQGRRLTSVQKSQLTTPAASRRV